MATVDFGPNADSAPIQNDLEKLRSLCRSALQDATAGITAQTLQASNGTAAAPSYSFTNNSNMGFYRDSLDVIGISVGGTSVTRILSSTFALGTTSLSWGSSAAVLSGPILTREGDTILSQRNSTDAQEFRVYNTYTDASNNEYGALDWDTNVLKVGTVKNGSGTKRAMTLLGTQIIQDAPGSAPADAALAASQITFWVNEAGNALTVKVKYADGTTVKSGTVALT